MKREPAPPVRLSAIVPSWHDADNLAHLLPQLARMPALQEVIVVDASGDATAEEIAQACGVHFLRCAKPSRGAQMNLGAQAATGDVLIFQHCDTELREAHLDAIARGLREPEVIGGAFYRKFDARHPHLLWLEKVARWLTRHGGTLFGDQTVFVRREEFLRLGGFAEIPLMEDVEFSRRLRAAGAVVILDPPVQSSARRHLREGAWRKSIQNGLFLLLFKLGVSPERLHRWYYRRGRGAPNESSLAPPTVQSKVPLA